MVKLKRMHIDSKITTRTTKGMRKAQSHLYLFISCELDGSFWGNFQDIHPVAPPQ